MKTSELETALAMLEDPAGMSDDERIAVESLRAALVDQQKADRRARWAHPMLALDGETEPDPWDGRFSATG